MALVITSANNITPYLFVKNRLINPDLTTNDVFVTVANVVDIEDYAATAPATNQTFWRDSSVSLVAETETELNDIFNTVLYLLELVCQQTDDLNTSSGVSVWSVDGAGAVLS